MNRRYMIAGVTVVAVAGLWFMYNQSHSGGSSSGTVASSAAGGPRISGQVQAGTVPTSQLYGVVTATTPTGQTLAAEFDINGEPVVAYDGDAIPPETQQFNVDSMTTGQVVLGLNGALLANGASTVTIKVGQTLTLDDQTAHTTTVIHLLSVHPA